MPAENSAHSMNKPKHILVLNYEYPPVGGGAGQGAHNLCRCFAESGIRVTVITGWVPGLKFGERQGRLRIIRVPMLKARRDRTTPAGMASYILSALAPLAWVCAKDKVDLIHAHFALPVGFLALVARRLFQIPYVVTLHGGDVPGFVPEQTDRLFRYARRAAERVVQNAERVIGVSAGLSQMASGAYGSAVDTIPNGIAPEWILPAPGPEHEGPIRLIFTGRLTVQKNVSALIAAMKLLRPETSFRLDILGDGPLLSQLKDEARGSSNIVFHGWRTLDEVRQALKEADIFVLPSYSEGLSIAGLQALSRACAMVVSDIPMNAELLSPGVNGYYCSHSAQSIARAIQDCLPELKRLKQGSLDICRDYGWDRIALQYMALFDEIMAQNRRILLLRPIEPNYGDMLSRYGLMRRIAACARPFVVLSDRPASELPAEATVVRPGPFKDLLPERTQRKLHSCHAEVWWACGHDLQDDSSALKLPFMAVKFMYFRSRGMKVRIVAQGAGPIRTAWGRLCTRAVMRLVHTASFRDPESLALITAIAPGSRQKYGLTIDQALYAPEPGSDARPEGQLVIGVNLRRWFHLTGHWLPYEYRARLGLMKTAPGQERRDILLKRLSTALDAVAGRHGARMVFLPMYPNNREPWEDDLALLKELKSRMSAAPQVEIIDADLGPRELLQIIGRLDVMLGVRLHSTIAATLMGKPALHLGYSPKGLSYFKLIGFQDNCLPIESLLEPQGATLLANRLSGLIEHRQETSAGPLDAIAHLKERYRLIDMPE